MTVDAGAVTSALLALILLLAIFAMSLAYVMLRRARREMIASLSALGEAVGRLHDEDIASLAALGKAVGQLHGESSASLSALGEAVGRLHGENAGLNERLNAVIADQRTAERALMAYQNQLARLSFALGSPGHPSDIVLGDLDSYDRLDQNWQSFRDTAGKQQSPLTIEGARKRTAVVITLGQSNAANHGSGSYTAKHRVDNFNLYDGCCYHAVDPLLGASGEDGNFATRLGDKVIEAGWFDRVILAPIAMGGTTVEQWADEGMFNRRILALLRRLYDVRLTPDWVLWHQGEGNSGIGDADGRQYRKNLLEVVGTFRRYGVGAPFFVALATLCGDARHPNAINIRAGQKSAVDPMAGVYLGPDTDTIGVEHRWDKCHFDETGLDLAASLWLGAIGDYRCSRENAVRSERNRMQPPQARLELA